MKLKASNPIPPVHIFCGDNGKRKQKRLRKMINKAQKERRRGV